MDFEPHQTLTIQMIEKLESLNNIKVVKRLLREWKLNLIRPYSTLWMNMLFEEYVVADGPSIRKRCISHLQLVQEWNIRVPLLWYSLCKASNLHLDDDFITCFVNE